MQDITLQDVIKATGGRFVGGPAEAMIQTICTDSRNIRRESLFIAIKGDTFDGHEYLQKAADGGSVAALVHSPVAAAPCGMSLILVDNTRKAMGRLAHFVRSRFGPCVIGIGGSNGKTSTKHLVDSVLGKKLRGTRSDKSFNNDIGVPLTLFAAGADDDYVVVEMGTNHAGEMSVLTRIAEPDIAIIMNAAPEHLEGLGNLDGVRKEEASIIEHLRPHGLLVVNGDDPALLSHVAEYPGKRVTFGLSPGCDLRAQDIHCRLEGTCFRVNGGPVLSVPLVGRHFAVNALAAIAVAQHMGLSAGDISDGLGTASSPEMRMEVQRVGDITVLNDAYNANPASMSAALETFASLELPGRRVAILGGMRELGPTSQQLHWELGAAVAKAGIDVLLCLGDLAGDIAEGALAAGMPVASVHRFADAKETQIALPLLVRDGDTLLLKGSRGVHVEQVLQALGVASPAGAH